ncbi:acylase [SAR92 clade bacterium H921]|nr:acylase [SAR92 clade bacterium H921]
MRLITSIFSLILLNGCAEKFIAADYLQLNLNYDVVIERDHLGVPHVMGERDVDTAFGFAYAQAEDNWQIIHDSVTFYRGTNAAVNGKDAAIIDFLVKWLGIWDTIEADYDSQLSLPTRAYIEAFADGINYYAALHPEQTNRNIFPINGKDIVAGYMLRHLLFYGFDTVLSEIYAKERQRSISLGPESEAKGVQSHGVTFNNLPIGSNAFSVSPHFSTDGATRLAINSHQPTTGPVAWYEAHIQSNEGLNIMGGLFPSSVTIGVGFTENLGWGATVNKPDLVDVYVLDIDPNDPMRYRLDGKWKTLEARDLDVEVKIFGFLNWTSTQEGLRSVHGPVLRTDHGTYAIRYAGMNELRQVEQWLAMNKAQTFEDWRNALRMQAFASFNFVYADREGNTMFVHNSLTPKRNSGYDWTQYLPGDDSRLIWDSYMAFDDLPQVINPKSGYLHSANQSPFYVTAEGDNPIKANYRLEDGFPTRMTNRADRGLELFAELGPISEEEFSAIKHDKSFSKNSRSMGFINKLIALDLHSAETLYQDAQQVIAQWDRNTNIENRGAALSSCVIGSEWLAEQKGLPEPDVRVELIRCADLLMAKTGRLDPLWGDVNRHVRGDLNVPVGGGPDTLRAIYGVGMEEDGFLTNVAGDGLYYLLSWNASGEQKIRGIHQYGAATLDETSPHYADQAQDYVNEVLHDPLFDAKTRAPLIERRYRPGE